VSYKAKKESLPCFKSHVLSFTDTARYVKFIALNADIGLKAAPNPYEIDFQGQRVN